LAYLVPLDVDVVPIKFHQFLFCYDHFCAFHFFSILAVSMATAAILKKKESLKAQLHMAYDIHTRFHKVCSRHLRETCQIKLMWKKEE
jgi:hypothetical protein